MKRGHTSPMNGGSSDSERANAPGLVSLVGAGPGDPGLLTIKGLARLRGASCVVYDALVNESLLAEAREDAELCYVGKRGGHHSMSQDGINDLLVEKATQHDSVCRLKGGDPFVFGRGGEEALHLVEHGVPFEVVPGITSAVAAPAYAGIPVTHRGAASSVAFITGHEDPTKPESVVDWGRLGNAVDTLVILMGVGRLRTIAAELIAGGRDPATPVALVRWGTTPEQETLCGRLSDIADEVERAGFTAPAATIVGDVVGLREKLSWFEALPLFGQTIVVTRARAQASRLSEQLRALGAAVVEVPAIRIVPPESYDVLDAAIRELSSYDIAIFTSVNGVGGFIDRLSHHGLDLRALAGVEIACIGPKTAEALTRRGIRVQDLPERFVAEGLVELFASQDLKGKRVVIPRAAEARETLPRALREQGAQVDVCPVYATVQEDTEVDRLVELIEAGRVDWVTFASGGTVSRFVALLGIENVPRLLAEVSTAAIGPVTARALEDLGLSADVVADESTIDGLVRAVVEHVRDR